MPAPPALASPLCHRSRKHGDVDTNAREGHTTGMMDLDWLGTEQELNPVRDSGTTAYAERDHFVHVAGRHQLCLRQYAQIEQTDRAE